MVPIFTMGLVLSSVGLAALLYIKNWELSTGRVVAARARPRVTRASERTLVVFEQILPTLLRVYSRRAWRSLLRAVHRAAAWVVLHIEHALEHTLYKLRRSTDVRHVPTEASLFLRQVAEHKKKILIEKESESNLHKE